MQKWYRGISLLCTVTEVYEREKIQSECDAVQSDLRRGYSNTQIPCIYTKEGDGKLKKIMSVFGLCDSSESIW